MEMIRSFYVTERRDHKIYSALFELNSKQEKGSSYGFAVVYVPRQNEVFWVKK